MPLNLENFEEKRFSNHGMTGWLNTVKVADFVNLFVFLGQIFGHSPTPYIV